MYPNVRSVASLTSTTYPRWSIVTTQSNAALRIALLRASLSSTACCARQRSTHWPIWEPRLLIVSSRSSSSSRGAETKNSITASRPVVPRTGNAKPEHSPAAAAAAARGKPPSAATSGIHAGSPLAHTRPGSPSPERSCTARLSATKPSAAPGRVHAARHASAGPSGSQTAPTSHASDSQTAASSSGYASASLATDASTRDTACSVRSRTVTSER